MFLHGRSDTGEFSQALFSIDGGTSTVLSTLSGSSSSNFDNQTDGYNSFSTTLSLDAGDHTIALGGFMNNASSNDRNERSNIRFDNVEIDATPIFTTGAFEYTANDGALDSVDPATVSIEGRDTQVLIGNR